MTIHRKVFLCGQWVNVPTHRVRATDLMTCTQASLAQANLKLYKITINSTTVLKAFPPGDLAKGMKDLSLSSEILSTQRSLGLCWETNTFTFQVLDKQNPFTCCGVLSTVNSVDPLGLVAPVTIHGRALLWELFLSSDDTKAKTFSCAYSQMPPTWLLWLWLRVVGDYPQVGFIIGKAQLTPHPETTIPHSELCAVVLAVEMVELIRDAINLEIDAIRFYCDSKVVLEYIFSETKCFFVYVYNRVQCICQFSYPDQLYCQPIQIQLTWQQGLYLPHNSPKSCGSLSLILYTIHFLPKQGPYNFWACQSRTRYWNLLCGNYSYLSQWKVPRVALSDSLPQPDFREP